MKDLEKSLSKIAGDLLKMAKKAEARITINLACTECKERTYTSSKNKKNDPGRLELKKFCPRCGTQTLHRETK